MNIERLSAIRAATLGVLLILGAPGPADADWRFTGFVGRTFHGFTTIVDAEDAAKLPHWHLGGAATLIGEGPIGLEAIGVYTLGFFNRKSSDDTSFDFVTNSHSFALMGNVVLAVPRRGDEYGLRPFVSGGLGLLQASRTDFDRFSVSTNMFGYNLGGGAVGTLSNRTGIRFDLRYFRSLRGATDPDISVFEAEQRYWTASIGLVIRPWQR